MIHDAVFNTNSPNLVFWVSIVVDIQTVSIAIASAGVFAAAIYYILQIRHQAKTRQMETIIMVNPWSRMTGEELREAMHKVEDIKYENLDDYIAKYSEKSEDKMLVRLADYFEGIGILLHRKLVDVDAIYDLWGPAIIELWEKVKPVIEEMRKRFNQPTLYTFYEYLHKEMKKRQQERTKYLLSL